MDAVTYPDDRVARFIGERMVPLRVAHDAQPLAADFNVQWTPTLVTVDPEGKEHHRTVGYLAPEEVIPSLLLGIAKWHFDAERFDDAVANFEKIIAEYPKSEAAPEAVYLRGVSRYKSTRDSKYLRQVYDELVARYPSSVWAQRATPYQTLEAQSLG